MRRLVIARDAVQTAAMVKGVPTRKEFEEMAARGRLHTECDAFIPSEADLDAAQSAVELGRLYGFSEDDIAHFYKSRRRGVDAAYAEYVRDLELAKIPPAAPGSGDDSR